MRAVYGIVAREFVRFLRQRGRVLASIGRPFVWLVFAGGGFAAVFAGRNEIDYRVYMAPGLLGMVVMFGSLLSALSTVTDREAGVLRMMIVAPIRRGAVALGKALGATLLGTAQAVVGAGLLRPLVQLRPTLAGTPARARRRRPVGVGAGRAPSGAPGQHPVQPEIGRP